MAEQTIQPKVLARMDRQTYEAFEKQFPHPVVDHTMTPQEVGYRLGIQDVLARLRRGFVVGA